MAYYVLSAIILDVIGIILLIAGILSKKRRLWIPGLVISLLTSGFLLWAFSM